MNVAIRLRSKVATELSAKNFILAQEFGDNEDGSAVGSGVELPSAPAQSPSA
jgi:Na+-transporting methylmalonyl-CoA/oxaloacetate decarboxylase beta subunit